MNESPKRHFGILLTQKILMLQSKTVVKRRIAIENLVKFKQFHETLIRSWFFELIKVKLET